MSAATLEKILHEAESLSLAEKTILADQLYSKIGMSKELEVEWRIELDRRANLSATGKMSSITLSQFREKYGERINRHRKRPA